MKREQATLLQGTLDMLILKALATSELSLPETLSAPLRSLGRPAINVFRHVDPPETRVWHRRGHP